MQLDWLLQPLLTQLNTGVLVLNDQHEVVFFNQFIARRADKQLEQSRGLLVYDVFDDLPRAWLQRKIDGVLSLQAPAFSSWEQRQYILKLPHLRPLSSDSLYMAQNCSMLPLTAPDGSTSALTCGPGALTHPLTCADGTCTLTVTVTDAAGGSSTAGAPRWPGCSAVLWRGCTASTGPSIWLSSFFC